VFEGNKQNTQLKTKSKIVAKNAIKKVTKSAADNLVASEVKKAAKKIAR